MGIRDATLDDLEGMARAHARSAHRAYCEYLEPDALAEIDEARMVAMWREQFDTPGRRAFVWDQDGTIAGHATLVGDDLRMLYVDPPAQGAGVGTALLRHAENHGARVLRTFARNAAARAFYEHHGWVADGDDEPWWGHATVRYVRRQR